MTDLWTGSILLPDNIVIEDTSLSSQTVALSPTLPSASLLFLATVDTARIPLYLAAGPSLDVWTTSEATEAWFASILLSKPAGTPNLRESISSPKWWACARAQSPIGILVKVNEVEIQSNGPRITEILFYGTIAVPVSSTLPTPPSSSPDATHAQSELLPELKVHALPLSSDLLEHKALSGISPPSPALDAAAPCAYVEPRFLAPLHTPETNLISPKRKHDVFDEATLARKKARSKGGEGVAAAAARAQESQHGLGHRKSLSTDTSAVSLVDSRPNSANGGLSYPPSRPHSRSPSISSDVRPLSRKGTIEGQSKRSNLSRVATMSLQLEEPTIESRNKEALSRVVMAAMRMQGLQQRRKTKSRRGSVAPGAETGDKLDENAAAEEAARDEEFKLVYHQTYKAAAAALRKHIATKPLHSQPDRLRDVVEKLLAIFCTDPLAQSLPTAELPGTLATPGSKNKLGAPGSAHSRASPFDLPSGARLKVVRTADGRDACTGSPVSKKVPDTQQDVTSASLL